MVYADQFPYESVHKPNAATHTAALTRIPHADHIDPNSGGRGARDESNLATACIPCNAQQSRLDARRPPLDDPRPAECCPRRVGRFDPFVQAHVGAAGR